MWPGAQTSIETFASRGSIPRSSARSVQQPHLLSNCQHNCFLAHSLEPNGRQTTSANWPHQIITTCVSVLRVSCFRLLCHDLSVVQLEAQRHMHKASDNLSCAAGNSHVALRQMKKQLLPASTVLTRPLALPGKLKVSLRCCFGLLLRMQDN